jgi:hypothetical protein
MSETVPYDGYALYDLLGEIQGLFAELRYIDTALDYLEGEEAGWLQEYLGGIVTPGTEYLEVEFGQTYPFTKRYTVPSDWYDSPFGIFDDTRSERIRGRLGELGDEAGEWAATQIEDVKQRIEPFTWPQGDLYESDCLAPVGEMHALLEDQVSEDFGLLQHTISDWKGNAADNFASYFYFPFEHTVRSQKQMLTALMGGIAAAKAIAESSQHSIMNVVNATKAVLRAQLELAQATAARERRQSQQRALILVGGTATVFVGIITAGAAAGSAAALWIASFEVIAGSTQLATLAIPDGGATEFNVQGSTAQGIRDSLMNALGQIKENDADEHEVLAGEIEAVLSRVDTLRGGPDGEDGRLVPISPTSSPVSTPTPSTCHESTIQGAAPGAGRAARRGAGVRRVYAGRAGRT